MVSLLVRNVQKFGLQTEASQRDLRIRSIKETFKLQTFELRKENVTSFSRKFDVPLSSFQL